MTPFLGRPHGNLGPTTAHWTQQACKTFLGPLRRGKLTQPCDVYHTVRKGLSR